MGCKKTLPKIWFKGKLCRRCAPVESRGKRLIARFGITLAEYTLVFAAQGGVCAICGNSPKKTKFPVDHNHKTGVIRGIPCKRCNHDLLGGAHDSIAILKRAIAYLENPPAIAVLGVRIAPPRTPKKPRLTNANKKTKVMAVEMVPDFG